MNNDDILKRFEGIEQAVLANRIIAIEKHIEDIKQGPKKEPWWKQTAMVGLIGGIIAATPAITAVIQGYFQSVKANNLQERQQTQVLVEKFINMLTDSQKPPEARQMILRYLMRKDENFPVSITEWAKIENEKVTIQIEQLQKDYDTEQQARKLAESKVKSAKEQKETSEKQYQKSKKELEEKNEQLKKLQEKGSHTDTELKKALEDKNNAEIAVNIAMQDRLDADKKSTNAETEFKQAKEKMESNLTNLTNQLAAEKIRTSDLDEQVKKLDEKLNKLCQTIIPRPAECR